jgi:hypothetical protein
LESNRPGAVQDRGGNALRSNGKTRDSTIEGLVGLLRQIHAARTTGRTGGAATAGAGNGGVSEALAIEPLGAAAVDATGLPDALAELLSRAAEHYRPRKPEPRDATLYEALEESIRQTEAATLAHHAAIDRLLRRADGGASAARPALVQETVYLQCARGGRTAGRFRCINRADAAVRARVRPGAITTPGIGRVKGAAITVSPRACALGPSEHAIINVTLDLQRCAAVAGGPLESCIEVELDGACALKVWVAVDLYDPTV